MLTTLGSLNKIWLVNACDTFQCRFNEINKLKKTVKCMQRSVASLTGSKCSFADQAFAIKGP